MFVKECDICKRFYECYNDRDNPPFNTIGLFDAILYRSYKKLDMCSDCMIATLDFLKDRGLTDEDLA